MSLLSELWVTSLVEAEARANDTTLPADVRRRSRETAELVRARLQLEDIDPEKLMARVQRRHG